MRALYVYGVMMVAGVLLMMFCSYQILDVLDAAKSHGGQIAEQPGVQSYVTISYIGVGLFLLGALGAIVMVLRVMNRK